MHYNEHTQFWHFENLGVRRAQDVPRGGYFIDSEGVIWRRRLIKRSVLIDAPARKQYIEAFASFFNCLYRLYVPDEHTTYRFFKANDLVLRITPKPHVELGRQRRGMALEIFKLGESPIDVRYM
jgi:hypothetical protein